MKTNKHLVSKVQSWYIGYLLYFSKVKTAHWLSSRIFIQEVDLIHASPQIKVHINMNIRTEVSVWLGFRS